MPPFILAAVGAVTLVFAYRLMRRNSERAALRQNADQRSNTPAETLVCDPETGIYRPSRIVRREP